MSWNSYYEVQLTKLQGVPQKSKTVYVYLTDRQVSLTDGLKSNTFAQVTIREFYLKLIPHKLATFRVAPHVAFSVQVLIPTSYGVISSLRLKCLNRIMTYWSRTEASSVKISPCR